MPFYYVSTKRFKKVIFHTITSNNKWARYSDNITRTLLISPNLHMSVIINDQVFRVMVMNS